VGSASQVIELAVPFLWLGMGLAISFLQSPLKFRAPDVPLPLGPGIGRLVCFGDSISLRSSLPACSPLL